MRAPISTSLRADADYRCVRDDVSQTPLKYRMYAPRPASCPPTEDPPLTCHWPEAVQNLREREEVSTRQRGGGRFPGGILNETRFHHGDGDAANSGTSGRLRTGSVVRGTLPRPTTMLLTNTKFQHGKGQLTTVDSESRLLTQQATVRRGGPRPSTALVGTSVYGLGRTPGNVGEPTAVRGRNKYTMAIASLNNQNRPIADQVVVEDFARGGVITRQCAEEVTMF